jgi:hypothetical protein
MLRPEVSDAFPAGMHSRPWAEHVERGLFVFIFIFLGCLCVFGISHACRDDVNGSKRFYSRAGKRVWATSVTTLAPAPAALQPHHDAIREIEKHLEVRNSVPEETRIPWPQPEHPPSDLHWSPCLSSPRRKCLLRTLERC